MQMIVTLLSDIIYFLFYVILLVLIATSPILFNFLALFMFLIYSGVLRHSEEVALGLRSRAKGKEQIFLFTSKALAVVAAIISTMKFFSL